MEAACKRLILFILLSVALLGSQTVMASTYREALEAYSDQKYSRAYKKAISVARDKTGTRRGKALILAAAAVLELDKEQKAKVLFKKALDEDPDLELPDVVRSKRAQRFFADIREGKDQRGSTTATRDQKTEYAFDRLVTYLPFGVNQLVQEKFLLGISLGAAQGIGIYNAYLKFTEADEVERNIILARQKAIQTGDDINPVFLEFVDQNTAFVKASRQQAQLSLLVAAAAYGGSVLEAGFRPPSPSRLRSRSASINPTTYQLFAVLYKRTEIRLDILNPIFSVQGLQLSMQF